MLRSRSEFVMEAFLEAYQNDSQLIEKYGKPVSDKCFDPACPLKEFPLLQFILRTIEVMENQRNVTTDKLAGILASSLETIL